MNDKQKHYQLINAQVAALIDSEPDRIANMANISAVLYNQLAQVNWAGFYLFKEEQLVLGPFQGQPACIRIPMGKGVCGTSAATQKTIIVKDVHDFVGHITCDAASNSEIVIPIIANGKLLGVLDLDSPIFNRFDEDDKNGLETVVKTFVHSMNVSVAV